MGLAGQKVGFRCRGRLQLFQTDIGANHLFEVGLKCPGSLSCPTAQVQRSRLRGITATVSQPLKQRRRIGRAVLLILDSPLKQGISH